MNVGSEKFAIFLANIALYLGDGTKLLMNVNRKSQTPVRSVSIPMILSDLERRDAMTYFLLSLSLDLHNNQQTSSWSITLMVVVGYGMRHATGADLAN